MLLAAAMAGAAVTVAYGLATGFDRAARQADLPDVIVRFRTESRAEIDRDRRALPNVAARSYRLEITGVGVGGNGRLVGEGQRGARRPGRRGYAIVAGRDVSGRPNEVVIERGVASAWHVGVGRQRPGRAAGIAARGGDRGRRPTTSPSRSPRRRAMYISRAWLEREVRRRSASTRR